MIKEETYTNEQVQDILDDIKDLPENYMDDEGIIGTWRYGHILIYKTKEEEEEDVYELVELYLDGEGNPHSWGPAYLGTVESLRMALKDAEEFPPVTKFYDEGKFEWEDPSGGWVWTKQKK